MKLRVLFLKKVHILLFICSFLFLLILLSFYIKSGNKNATVETFYTINNERLIKSDFTGDDKKDILYADTNSSKYFLSIISNNKIYTLNPSKSNYTLGNFYNYCPMNVYSTDINSDGTKELILQSMDRGLALQHIFMWNGKKFKDKFSSYSNIVGVDYENNGNLALISGNYSSGKLIWLHKAFYKDKISKLKNYNNLCTSDISEFIKYIENLQLRQKYSLSGILSPMIDGKYLTILDKLSNSNSIYKFTYGNFFRNQTNENRKDTDYTFILNFSIMSDSNYDTPNDYMTLTLKLKPIGDNFKIYSIDKGKLSPSNTVSLR
ncbi:hypothetical protein [Clostridium oryzae]|uniref:FG-GAP repeat protein n=1 Tax=Clostridium oryzae TaxID=1450648 RepID=A0A1V4I638_9CLOT|nr:hypothetical protein [Clostridium oryzae]OPJ55340.1 hypothetical protein CLORY_44320 [Clostridium oryzae]